MPEPDKSNTPPIDEDSIDLPPNYQTIGGAVDYLRSEFFHFISDTIPVDEAQQQIRDSLDSITLRGKRYQPSPETTAKLNHIAEEIASPHYRSGMAHQGEIDLVETRMSLTIFATQALMQAGLITESEMKQYLEPLGVVFPPEGGRHLAPDWRQRMND